MNIIINADDFGGTEELNSCVQRLHEVGVITSATLIANSPFFEDAVKISKNLPELGTGVHLILDGPFNVLNKPSSIIDPETNHFYQSFEAVKKLRFLAFNSEDIYKEYCAQVERILDYGIRISHIDHHHHYHIYFKSFNQVIRVARKYKIPCLRSQILLEPFRKNLMNHVYRNYHQYYAKKNGMIVSDGYFEFIHSVENPHIFNISRVKQLLDCNLSTFEIETHPKNNHYFDTGFLQHPEFIELISGHRLINYRSLTEKEVGCMTH